MQSLNHLSLESRLTFATSGLFCELFPYYFQHISESIVQLSDAAGQVFDDFALIHQVAALIAALSEASAVRCASNRALHAS
jgi:hypothetical protein